MRKAIAIMVAYVVAVAAACAAVGAASMPFLGPGDFDVPTQAVIISVLCVFHVLCFAPFAVAAHVLMRKARRHLALPLVAFPVFGALFAVAGWVVSPGRWWPEVPFAMDGRQLVAFLVVSLVAVGAGAAAALAGRAKPEAGRGGLP